MGLYYFRHLPPGTPRIKFNIVDPDSYSANVPFDIVKVTAIQTPEQYPALPAAERDRFKDVTFKYNPNLTGTPARIYSKSGVIEHGPDYMSFPRPVRLFIDLHEQGHLLYKTEEKCDLWALVNFLRMGYNKSTAFYALHNVLNSTPQNIKRLDNLLHNINISSDANNPYKA
jgi:hypothetical protein